MTVLPQPPEGSDALDADVFISYHHVDNEAVGAAQQQWITVLDKELSARLRMLFDDHVRVWRDSKVRGNDIFAEDVSELLTRVRVFVAVLSRGYLDSDWCQRELAEFVAAAELGTGLRVGRKSRIFKVVKSPVSLEALPEPLVEVIGYDFHEDGSEYLTGPSDDGRKFFERAYEVADDIARLLRALRGDPPIDETGPLNGGRTVYLAETTSDVADSRTQLKRELERRGHRVLPEDPLPLVPEELLTEIREELSAADLSVHLLGARYGTRPEGEERSIPVVQFDIAEEFAARGELDQLVWTAEHQASLEEAQAMLIERIARANGGTPAELFRVPLQQFKAEVLEKLKAAAAAPSPAASPGAKSVYLVHAPEDRESVAWLHEQLGEHKYDVSLPLGSGRAEEVREIHQDQMVYSDAVLIYHGRSSEYWVKTKLNDIKKVPGWGRERPFQAAGLWLAPPSMEEKESLRHELPLVMDATRGNDPSILGPFLDELGRAGASR